MPRALVLIDIQNDYFPGGAFPLVEPDEAARVASQILEAFRDSGEPIFHIQHVATEPDATFFKPGTPGVEIHPAVAPEGSEPVIRKASPNAFLGTSLQADLEAAGTKDLVVLGMMTSTCVDSTVRAASDLGYSVTVAADACAAPDLSFDGVDVPGAAVHAAFIAALRDSFAKIAMSHELI
ncbi:MAG: cysteine hydrolase family protein [Solirubrobacteraceae bacterium]|nr:cysteine hydrolase family protein [Patulibacter sp.]